MTPNPQPAIAELDPDLTSTRRRLGCTRENFCLAWAARALWDALSCNGCSAFAPITDVGQRRADEDGLIRLAGLALSNRNYIGPSGPRRKG